MKTLLAAIAVGTFALAPVPTLSATAIAAATTCHGLPATVVGTPGVVVTGTEGDDVIVTEGAITVTAAGGADTICVTGTADKMSVDAGAGDDVVDTSEARGRLVHTFLRAGADTVLGGPIVDWVVDGSELGPDEDRIETRGGDDIIVSGAGGQSNHDVLVGGAGDDLFHVRGTLEAPGLIAAGGHHNQLHTGLGRTARTAIDLQSRTVERDGTTVMSWQGRIDEIHITGRADQTQKLVFSGTGGPDVLTLGAFGSSPTVIAHLRAGDDRLEAPFHNFAAGSRFSAGPGADTLQINVKKYSNGVVSPYSGDVDLDLQTHHLAVTRDYRQTSAIVRGFDRVEAGSHHSVRVHGDEHPNSLVAWGCAVRLDGRGQDDTVRVVSHDQCQGTARTLVGGPGDDLLTGGGRADLLLGGPGHDVADGRGGTDTCRAEVERGCER